MCLAALLLLLLRFSLYFNICHFNYVCLGVDLLGLILFGVLCASCMSVFFPDEGALISLNKIFTSFSLLLGLMYANI